MHITRVPAIALLLWAGAAPASSFSFTFAGTQTHFRDAWECPSSICDSPAPIVSQWGGTLQVMTAADVDGTYRFDSLRIVLNGQMLPTWADLAGLYVVVSNGSIATMSGSFAAFPPDPYSTDGSTLTWTQAPQHHVGPTYASATLSPTSVVAEPVPLALLLAGLLATFARKHA